jgi:hypothetical protein
MQDLLPAVLATLRDSEDEVATAVVPFLNSWVARLKANQKRTGGVPTVSFHAVYPTHIIRRKCHSNVLKLGHRHLV